MAAIKSPVIKANNKGLEMEFKEIAKVDEIPIGEMRKYEVDSVEITIANLEGSYFAFNDRCPHMNAPLHMGKIKGAEVVCPFHKARFDLQTGKKQANPKFPIPKAFKIGKMLASIKANDMIVYETKVEDGGIFVKL